MYGKYFTLVVTHYVRTDIKGRKGYVKKCHAAGRTIAQLGAAMGQRKVIPTVSLHLFNNSTEIGRNVFPITQLLI